MCQNRPLRPILAMFDDRAEHLRPKVIGLYAILGLANLLAWLWAAASFRNHPLLLATSLIAYGFGLRHAVDADHIAAIDNVTRKLMRASDRSRWVSISRSAIPRSCLPPRLRLL
jgi:high-affinity nickel-transport protein